MNDRATMSLAPDLKPTPPSSDGAASDAAAGKSLAGSSQLRRRVVWVGLVAISIVAVAWFGYRHWVAPAAGPTYRMGAATRGPVTATVIASGTVNAVITVQVGSQVSGQIKELDADFNTEVTKGQLIARIDPDTFETRLAQAQADVAVAKASVSMQQASLERAQADLESTRSNHVSAGAQKAKAKAALVDATRDYDRKLKLSQTGAGTLADRDKAQSVFDQAQAELGSTEALELSQSAAIRSAEAQIRTAAANVETAQAQVAQKEAAERAAQVDLDHTYIRAPVDGTVILRNVDVGQTVAASLQAPVLFTIAQDLRAMQVDASIDEADVGAIKDGQKVFFTVDAHPDITFEGNVVQVRKAPQVVQNVVTYDVVISAPNPDLLLLPGLTANVRVVTAKRDNALLVPNGALRYGQLQAAKDANAAKSPQVYAIDSVGAVKPVAVKLGITDGNATEIADGDLKEGQQLVIGEIPSGAANASNSLPGFGGPRF